MQKNIKRGSIRVSLIGNENEEPASNRTYRRPIGVYNLLMDQSDSIQSPKCQGAVSPTSAAITDMQCQQNESAEYVVPNGNNKKTSKSKAGRSMASTRVTLNLSSRSARKKSYPPTGVQKIFHNVDTTTLLSTEPISQLNNSCEQKLFRNKSMFSPPRTFRNNDVSRGMLQTSRPNYNPKIEADSSRLQAALEHVQT